MTIHLDPASPVPIYLQIVDQVRRLIALGALRPGDRLPAVRDLAAQCRINRNTAARAIQELEREGVVRTQVGQGTFVAAEPPPSDSTEGEQAVDAQCDRLIVEARSRQVPLEQIPSRLWRRIDAFRHESAAEGAGSAGDAGAAQADNTTNDRVKGETS
jgi:GntR family transcriptional regulator